MGCKGYSVHQFYFGIRGDINGQKYRKQNEQMLKNLNVSSHTVDLCQNDDELKSFLNEDDEQSADDNLKLAVIDEHSSEEKHDELMENANNLKKRTKTKHRRASTM